MIGICRTFTFVAISIWTFTAPLIARAQEPQLGNSYGQGVNAYFAGRSSQAESLLSGAIGFDSQDPRPYYFRALSLLRQGRIDEARGDMLVGATLEAQRPHRFAIGAALERVQGADRLMLEEYRNNARRDVAERGLSPANTATQTQKYIERDAAVLRDQRVVPLDELLRPGGPRSIAVESTNASPNTPPQVQNPATTPAAASADPFADDAARPAPEAAPAKTIPPKESSKPAPAVVIPPQEAPKPAPPANPPADDNPFG